MSKIECRCCRENTEKRVVLKRNPLQKVHTILPGEYQELFCNNKIKALRSFGRDENESKILKWFEEVCENHILVKKIKKYKKVEG